MRKTFLLLTLVLLAGCAQQIPAVHGLSQLAREEERIIGIVSRALAASPGYRSGMQCDRPRRDASGAWSVVVSRLPLTPGGFCIVTVAADDAVAISVGGK